MAKRRVHHIKAAHIKKGKKKGGHRKGHKGKTMVKA